MSDQPESVDPGIVEERGDKSSILLQAERWDRWVDGSVQSMKLIVKQKTRVLCISVASKEIVIASLGTWRDRSSVAASLQRRYGLKTPSELAQAGAPAGWELEPSGDGFVSLRDASSNRSFIGCSGAISGLLARRGREHCSSLV